MPSNYLRNFAIAIIAASAALAPVVIEMKQDLREIKKDFVFAEARLSQLEDAMFFIAANAQSGNRAQNVRELERILGRESPYMPSIEPESIPYQIELFITAPKDLY